MIIMTTSITWGNDDDDVVGVLSGDEMQEKHVLEEQLKTIIDKYRHKRGLLRELQEDMQVDTVSREYKTHKIHL